MLFLIWATYNQTMPNLSSFLLILILLVSSKAQWSSCPSGNPLNIVQGALTVTQGGNIPLQQGRDIQCYNYTLASSFQSSPNVAIAVTQFDSQYSSDLFFTIKVAASNNYQTIPFIVRTQWKYTQWSRISFNFVAQTSSQIEAGFYQIQTSTLSSCRSGKQIVTFMPIQNQASSMTKALTFLNGFQISSIAPNTTYLTPFEVSVIVSSVTPQGLTLVIQSTSATQIHSLFISFLAYDLNIQNLMAGTYKYDLYTPSNYLQFAPPKPVGGNNLAFHGFSSFMLINAQANFDLSSQLQNNQLIFSSSNAILYLAYDYLLLLGGPCGQCQGYPISYLGQCVSTCPVNTHNNGFTCITCQPGFAWNGNNCIYRCTSPQVWNSSLNNCACPPSQNWNGSTCISCQQGQVWNALTQSCACPNNANWNGFVCIICNSGQIWNSNSMSCQCPAGTGWNGWTCMSCPQGQVWNSQQNNCSCPSGQNWNGSSCISCGNGLVWNSNLNACGCSPGYILFRGSCAFIPTCSAGQVLDTNSNTCVCSSGANWNGFSCITCFNGQIWSNNQCQCPSNTFWNSYSCITCPPGQFWSSAINACSCPRGQNWNGFDCIACTGGRAWNPTINSCACQPGQNWNGNQCITCSNGANWNGFSCVTCSQGQVWNPTRSICECPQGQQWNGSSCILPCSSGMVSINGVCVCPSGSVMLLNGNCQSKPNCPNGQTWNGSQCVPIQCPPGTFWSNNQCTTIPPVTCPASTFFDGLQCTPNSTACPSGTQWNGTSCTSTGSCPNGTYSNGGACVPIFNLCPVGLVWQNNRCVVTNNNQCPQGSYFLGGACIPIQPCANGKVWSTTHSQCTCPSTTFWNGNVCMQCSNGQGYQASLGCLCPSGTYLNGTSCIAITVTQCASITNAIWSGSKCVCNSGFSQVGLECACQGLVVSASFCDRCYTKPNSKWVNGICQCNPGYHQISGKCQQIFPNSNPPAVPSCNVATYWDDQQKRCLPCSSGCLSCITCYECTSCQPGFYMDYNTALCIEMCGDGKRFTMECDDGNNNNGDGCSLDCKVQRGYSCTGGSPSSKDSCTMTLPSALTFTSTGQAHLYGKIVLNVRVNYLPQELIKSANDCANKCNNVLAVSIVSGDRATTGIKASYVLTTSFSFSIEIYFGREPIGLFTVQVGINPNLVQKYFSGIDTSNNINIDVNPAFLSLYTPDTAAGSNASPDILE